MNNYHELADAYLDDFVCPNISTSIDQQGLINKLHLKFQKFQLKLNEQTKGLKRSEYKY